jgi:alpha-N-arabinofuranosidase
MNPRKTSHIRRLKVKTISDGLRPRCAVALGLLLTAGPLMLAQTGNGVNLQIKADQITAHMPPTFHGLMTEEINYAFEGGLYAELIRNRNFKEMVPARVNRQNPDQSTPAKETKDLVHWSLVQERGGAGSMMLDTAAPLNSAVPASLKLTVSQASGEQRVGVANDGFWGIPVRPNTTYKAMFYAKAAGYAGGIEASIVSNDGATVAAAAQVLKIGDGWQKYELTLTTRNVKASADYKFVLSANRPGAVWFGFVSLFPPTYKNRTNGFRPDIMELLAGIKPQFLRFPGGNYLEGNTFDTRFNWKNTIGPIEERPGHLDDAWGYWSSDGMGLLEYLGWCEDLNMEPVLAVFAGYSLRGQKVKPGPELDVFVKEALEEIEYVSGEGNTTWGARRARDGHAAPFKLRYVEIGNEDFSDREKGSYDARYTAFYDAIKAKYPNLQIIESSGNAAANITTRTPDVTDEHYYRGSDDMAFNANNYDARSRGGRGGRGGPGGNAAAPPPAIPKVFVGEWATRVGSPTPNLEAAIADAANMAGLERNADLVIMHCYAPLFVNVNPGAMQWTTDLIGYDAMTSYGSPAYWAQQMFANHSGDSVLNISATGIPYREYVQAGRGRGGFPGAAQAAPDPNALVPPTPMPRAMPDMFFSATKDSSTVYVKIVNRSAVPQQVHITVSGLKSIAPNGRTITLSSAGINDTNSIADPHKVEPVTADVTGLGSEFTRTAPASSVTVLEIKGN